MDGTAPGDIWQPYAAATAAALAREADSGESGYPRLIKKRRRVLAVGVGVGWLLMQPIMQPVI